MSSAKKASPGKALVESLTRQLAANMEFDETETNTLDLIAHAADRPAAVRARFDVLEHQRLVDAESISLATRR